MSTLISTIHDLNEQFTNDCYPQEPASIQPIQSLVTASERIRHQTMILHADLEQLNTNQLSGYCKKTTLSSAAIIITKLFVLGLAAGDPSYLTIRLTQTADEAESQSLTSIFQEEMANRGLHGSSARSCYDSDTKTCFIYF